MPILQPGTLQLYILQSGIFMHTVAIYTTVNHTGVTYTLDKFITFRFIGSYNPKTLSVTKNEPKKDMKSNSPFHEPFVFLVSRLF